MPAGTTRVSPWLPTGSDLRPRKVALFVVAILLASSCSLFSGLGKHDEADNDEPDADSVSDAAANPDDEVAGNGLPHPRKATAWDTRVLISTTPQPPAAKVRGCIDEMRTAASEAQDQQAMLAAETQLAPIVAKDPQLFHYCFFQMAVALDDRLARQTALFDDLAPEFLAGMRSLWIFARAMDQGSGRTRYFDYLKGRYVQISKELFGRELTPVAPPMRSVKPAH